MARTAEQAPAYNLARRKANTSPEDWARHLEHRRSRPKHPNRSTWYRRSDLKRHYGMTVLEWDELFLRQGRRCAVCKSADPGNKNGHWATDHDHATGKVRGILCQGCNKALGHVKDDPDRLRMLAEYLEIGGARHARSKNR